MVYDSFRGEITDGAIRSPGAIRVLCLAAPLELPDPVLPGPEHGG